MVILDTLCNKTVIRFANFSEKTVSMEKFLSIEASMSEFNYLDLIMARKITKRKKKLMAKTKATVEK